MGSSLPERSAHSFSIKRSFCAKVNPERGMVGFLGPGDEVEAWTVIKLAFRVVEDLTGGRLDETGEAEGDSVGFRRSVGSQFGPSGLNAGE